MKVTLLNSMGTDLDVVNAARVSFDKESDWGAIIQDMPFKEDTASDLGWDTYNDCPQKGYLKEEDERLIHYLASHKHTSPFGHCFASFRVKAPIFVARQLVKHKFLRWNEVSRRYVDSEPEFYVPDVWRKKADNVKQGSSDEEVNLPRQNYNFPSTYFGDNGQKKIDMYHVTSAHAVETYQSMLALGVCPEQARMVLPQSMYTEWWWSGSLDAFADMCKLRLDPHTQKETRMIAEEISKEMGKIFPVSWDALIKGE